MIFDIGNGTRNMLLNQYLKEAAYRQTPQEHEELINKYVRPGMSPAQMMLAMAQGEQLERLNKKYWNEQTPRYDFSPSSSWISQVESLPDLGITRVTTDRGQSYYYPQSTDEAGNFVTSDSLGQYFNNYMKR